MSDLGSFEHAAQAYAKVANERDVWRQRFEALEPWRDIAHHRLQIIEKLAPEMVASLATANERR